MNHILLHENGLETKSNTDIDFDLCFYRFVDHFLEPQSVQNRFQSGLERALNEDSDSKLGKHRSRSTERFPAPLKLEVFGAFGGADVFTRRTPVAKA